MSYLDLLQVLLALTIAFASICRHNKLWARTTDVGAGTPQLGMLTGPSILGFGPWLPGSLRDPATVPSVLFSGCVLVCLLSGSKRWRNVEHRQEQGQEHGSAA